MSEKERLLRTLFETEGQEHLNIKFCRGTSDDISPEALCREANLAIFQMENGLVDVRQEFGDSHLPIVDVATM